MSELQAGMGITSFGTHFVSSITLLLHTCIHATTVRFVDHAYRSHQGLIIDYLRKEDLTSSWFCTCCNAYMPNSIHVCREMSLAEI